MKRIKSGLGSNPNTVAHRNESAEAHNNDTDKGSMKLNGIMNMMKRKEERKKEENKIQRLSFLREMMDEAGMSI